MTRNTGPLEPGPTISTTRPRFHGYVGTGNLWDGEEVSLRPRPQVEGEGSGTSEERKERVVVELVDYSRELIRVLKYSLSSSPTET